jgi:N-acetyl-gamma-glutamyl-phosphate reductase
MAKPIRVGIAGFRGYSGAEAVKLLRGHPRVETVLIEHRSDAKAGFSPNGQPAKTIPWDPTVLKAEGIRLVLLATPHEVSLEMVPAALGQGIKVIDLSGAFRLRTPQNVKRWYGMEHTRPDLLAEAAYGLPEFFRETVRDSRLVSNPGCYPTAANLALRPLVSAGILNRSAGVVCDAKSGVSGAGKKPSEKTHFCEVTENLSAYSVLNHRHVPEVLLTSGLEEKEFSFTAHLLPIHRGILETIYVRAAKPVTRARIDEIYSRAYANEPFVRIYPEGRLPSIQSVVHTNRCDIGIQMDAKSRRMVIVAAIDNLVKGAAGQAIQNMNLMLGFPETESLPV